MIHIPTQWAHALTTAKHVRRKPGDARKPMLGRRNSNPSARCESQRHSREHEPTCVSDTRGFANSAYKGRQEEVWATCTEAATIVSEVLARNVGSRIPCYPVARTSVTPRTLGKHVDSCGSNYVTLGKLRPH